MTAIEVTMTINVPEREDGQALPEFSFNGNGVDTDDMLQLLVAGAEGFARLMVQADLEKEAPFSNPEFVEATAALNARLLLIDTVMHLPMGPQAGLITHI